FRRVGLAEIPVLSLAHLHAGFRCVCVLDYRRERAHYLAIEAPDALSRARTHVERDIRHAQHDAAEAALIRRMHVDAITPRANGLDAVVAFPEIELGSLQRLAQLRQTAKQRGAVRDDQAGDAAQHVGLAGRQMELAHSDIDPHVAGASVEKGIARKTEAGDVILRCQTLVADADIDVPEIDDIAEILRRPVVLFFCHGAFSFSLRDSKPIRFDLTTVVAASRRKSAPTTFGERRVSKSVLRLRGPPVWG